MSNSFVELIVVLILSFAVFVGLAFLLQWVKKRVVDREDEPEEPTPAFTLSDLRRLHREGHLTDEELERAETMMVQAVRGGIDPETNDAAIIRRTREQRLRQQQAEAQEDAATSGDAASDGEPDDRDASGELQPLEDPPPEKSEEQKDDPDLLDTDEPGERGRNASS